MICIYHRKDLDGWMSGAIVKRKFPDVKLIGYDYGDPLPEIEEGSPVIMVDISFPMKDMVAMAEKSEWNLIWIDHHIKAIREFNEYVETRDDSFCVAHIDDKLSACELTWKAFFQDEPMPKAVGLLGMYDTFRKDDIYDWEEEILPFQYAMRSVVSHPDDIPPFLLDNSDDGLEIVKTKIKQGLPIIWYMEKTNSIIAKNFAFEAEFLGHKAICLNAANFSSLSFEPVLKGEHEVMIGMCFNGEVWKCSIYTKKENIDCSVLASKLGGGGHKKASGFMVNNIFDQLNNISPL